MSSTSHILALEEWDSLACAPKPWTFHGWAAYLDHCRRLRREAPFALRNGIQYRREKVLQQQWPSDRLDREVLEGQVLVQLALATLVEQGVL